MYEEKVFWALRVVTYTTPTDTDTDTGQVIIIQRRNGLEPMSGESRCQGG